MTKKSSKGLLTTVLSIYVTTLFKELNLLMIWNRPVLLTSNSSTIYDLVRLINVLIILPNIGLLKSKNLENTIMIRQYMILSLSSNDI